MRKSYLAKLSLTALAISFLYLPAYSGPCEDGVREILPFEYFIAAAAGAHERAAEGRGDADSYNNGMNSTMLDKIRIVEEAVEGMSGRNEINTGALVVDIGTGTGLLPIALAQRFPELNFRGIDLDPRMVQLAEGTAVQIRGETGQELDNISFRQADAHSGYTAPGESRVVVFSSILHEIFSYSGQSWSAVQHAFSQAHRSLSAGGRVVIRDFVAPENGARTVLLRHRHTDPADLKFDGYIEMLAQRGQIVAITRVARGDANYREGYDTYIAPLETVYNYVYRKDFAGNHESELNENYAWGTRSRVVGTLEAQGFRIERVTEQTNPWIESTRIQPYVEVREFDLNSNSPTEIVNMNYQMIIEASKTTTH